MDTNNACQPGTRVKDNAHLTVDDQTTQLTVLVEKVWATLQKHIVKIFSFPIVAVIVDGSVWLEARAQLAIAQTRIGHQASVVKCNVAHVGSYHLLGALVLAILGALPIVVGVVDTPLGCRVGDGSRIVGGGRDGHLLSVCLLALDTPIVDYGNGRGRWRGHARHVGR